jgi:hypothetical protein
MRRSPLIVVLLVVLVGGFTLWVGGSCGGSPRPRTSSRVRGGDSTRVSAKARRASRVKTAGDTLAGKAAKSASRMASQARGAKGRHGALQAMTPEERVVERKRLKEEKRRLRAETQRKRREERLALRGSKSRAGRHTGRRALYDAYMLKGTFAGRYALVGSRRLERGDVIAGKRLVDIGPDRITLEQFGNRLTVRIGEMVERGVETGSRRRGS